MKDQLIDKKEIKCCICNITTREVDSRIKQFKCSLCLDMKDPYVNQYFNKIRQNINQPIQTKVRKPRGWKFMKQFVDSQGNVYHRGVLIPQLKSTLPPTQIKEIQKSPKISTRQKEQNKMEAYAKVNQLKNEIMSAYQNNDKRKAHKLQKQLNLYKKQVKNILKKVS